MRDDFSMWQIGTFLVNFEGGILNFFFPKSFPSPSLFLLFFLLHKPNLFGIFSSWHAFLSISEYDYSSLKFQPLTHNIGIMISHDLFLRRTYNTSHSDNFTGVNKGIRKMGLNGISFDSLWSWQHRQSCVLVHNCHPETFRWMLWGKGKQLLMFVWSIGFGSGLPVYQWEAEQYRPQ